MVDSATRSLTNIQSDSANLVKKLIPISTAQVKTSNYNVVADKQINIKPHGACTLIRTRLLREAGCFSGTYGINDGEELATKLSHYKYIHIDKPVFFYRQHGNNLSLF